MQLFSIAKPKNRLQVGLVFVSALLAFLGAVLAWSARETVSLADPPEEIKDGVFYENMAYNLCHGRGFAFDFKDPVWRDKYSRVNQEPDFEGKFAWVLQLDFQGPTTTRPPAYPVFLAIIYSTCGWRWDVARLAGCLMASLGLATVVTWSWTRWGAVAAIISTATLMADFSVMTYAGYILTEPLVTGLVCLWFVVLVRAFEKPTIGMWMLGGVLLALLTCLRGNWSLWLLAMVPAAPLLAFPRVRRQLQPVVPAHLLIFFTTCCVLVFPWWVRNCVVTGHFSPLGTAGSRGLVAAYCDESLADHGNWQPDVFYVHQDAVSRQFDHAQLTLAQWEYEIGRQSTAKAIAWLRRNWRSLPRLAGERLITHFGLNQPFPLYLQMANIWLILLAAVGLVLTRGRVREILLLMLVLDSAVVMITWEHWGRYGIPLRPLVHLCYGLGATALLQWIGNQFWSHNIK